jgi:hypothetical protein
MFSHRVDVRVAAFRASVVGGALALSVVSLGTIAAADTKGPATIASAKWNAYVDKDPVNRCFHGFVASFEPVQSEAGAAPVTITHADYAKLSFGDDLTKPLATDVVSNDPGWQPMMLTVEREGRDVAYLLNAGGITARGFVVAAATPLAIASGSAVGGTSLEDRYAPALALISGNPGLTRCGLTRVTFMDATVPDGTRSIQVILRNGKLVGAVETSV